MDNCNQPHDTVSCDCQSHHEESVNKLRRRMNLLLRTGQILVDSSADTSRIMRNMQRAAAFLGFSKSYVQIYVDYYMVTVSFSDRDHSFVCDAPLL